eukprot:TRINITY_DN1652_c0_g1_i2.p1 TRINITY_DN1652_c0_g1~~TRINITY_DN1652_c0_g1_i2.p1  ORF type:complete len:276 (+),score=57.51 TRINITY_DN1652_c0_g1_i2:317-1144(+)
MLLTFGSWNAPTAGVTIDGNRADTTPKSKSADHASEEVLFVPMMLAIKKPRLTPFFAPPSPIVAPAMVVLPQQPSPTPITTKPVPKCWCPLSAPAKVCYRAKDDRLNPGRAYYECNNIPSCSFFAWRETNDEYKLIKDAPTQPTTSTQQQPTVTTPTTPVSKVKRKGSFIGHTPPTSAIAKSFKPSHKTASAIVSKSASSIKTPDGIEKRPTAAPATAPLPYVMSAPISIPVRRVTADNNDHNYHMQQQDLDLNCQSLVSHSNHRQYQSPRQLVF